MKELLRASIHIREEGEGGGTGGEKEGLIREGKVTAYTVHCRLQHTKHCSYDPHLSFFFSTIHNSVLMN